MIKELKLCYGLPHLAIFPRQAEADIFEFLDFTSGGDEYGFKISVANDLTLGWIPTPINTKSTLNRDSVLIDDVVPFLHTDGNITETMTLLLTANSMNSLYKNIGDIFKYRTKARNYTNHELEYNPVYLQVRLQGEKYTRYALIYNIEVVVDINYGGNKPSAHVTLDITRTNAWSGLPPTDNPRKWWKVKANETDISSSDVIFGGTHEIQETIENGVSYGSVGTPLYPTADQNWIDIPKEMIDGDAPAPALIRVKAIRNLSELYVARVSKPNSVSELSGGTLRQRFCNFNGCDGSNPNNVASAIYGAKKKSDGIRYVDRFVSTRTTRWGSDAVASYPSRIDSVTMNGRYAIYLRGRYNTVGGLATANLEIRQAGITQVDFSKVLANTNSDYDQTLWHYIDEVTFPLTGKTAKDPSGLGLFVPTTATGEDMVISLEIDDVDATDYYELIDLFLIPLDGQLTSFKRLDAPSSGGNADRQFIIDSCGYFNGDATSPLATVRIIDDVSSPLAYEDNQSEIASRLFYLDPAHDNRIFFFAYTDQAISEAGHGAQMELEVSVDYVPRWYGESY